MKFDLNVQNQPAEAYEEAVLIKILFTLRKQVEIFSFALDES